MREPLQWYDEKMENPPWIMALAELRQRATCEGHCFQHVQAITVAINQYAEKALGNREYFLNKPYGVGQREANSYLYFGPSFRQFDALQLLISFARWLPFFEQVFTGHLTVSPLRPALP